MKKSLTKNYLCHPNNVRLIDEGSSVESSLPSGVYKLCFNPLTGVYLDIKPYISEPDIMFGKAKDQVARIIKSFKLRETSTGVILHGIAGSGKTMITKSVAYTMQNEEYPVIFIDGNVPVNLICETLNDIVQDCVIVFDEFEKNFSIEDQNQMLSALDGVYSSKKLIMFTTNSIHLVSPFIRNRPSRALYSFEFEKMELDTLKEVLAHYGVEKEHVDDIIRVYKRCVSFSFDILRNILEEIRLHNCTVREAIDVLNIGVVSDAYHCLGFDISKGKMSEEQFTKLMEENDELSMLNRLVKYSLTGDVNDVMTELLDASQYPCARHIQEAGIKLNPKEIEDWILEGAENPLLLGEAQGIQVFVRPRYRYRTSHSLV